MRASPLKNLWSFRNDRMILRCHAVILFAYSREKSIPLIEIMVNINTLHPVVAGFVRGMDHHLFRELH